MRKLKMLTTIVLTALLIVMNIAGCSKSDTNTALLEGDLTKKIVMTVNNTEITMDTMMYYIMQQEAEYSYNDIYYTATYGTSYWDLEMEGEDSKVTVRQEVQEYIIEVAQLYEIFYQESKAKGYELTEEDIEEAELNAYTIWQNMSEHQKEVTNLTQEALTEIFKKISLATKYYDEVEAGLGVDEEAITKTIHQEDYKEYSIEIMYLDNTEEDKDGSLIDVKRKELKAALKRMKKYKEQRKKGESLETLLAEDEDRIYVTQQNFIEGDRRISPILEAEAVNLKNDENTDIIETNDGYFLIRMVDNAATDSYEEAVAKAIEDTETEAFEKAYEEIRKSYKTEIKINLWDQIQIGNLTIDEEGEELIEMPDATSEPEQ